jgi:hypothetical protein
VGLRKKLAEKYFGSWLPSRFSLFIRFIDGFILIKKINATKNFNESDTIKTVIITTTQCTKEWISQIQASPIYKNGKTTIT